VICSEHLKTVTIDVDGRARVDVRETLVFLHQPKAWRFVRLLLD
jgi:hypothetical protein